jgi:hypothetical protein
MILLIIDLSRTLLFENCDENKFIRVAFALKDVFY